MAMGEIASAMPTAGALYYWASKLGGPAWGWFTGWFNLVGQIAVTAAIDYGAAIFATALLNLWFPDAIGTDTGAIFITYTVIIGAAPRRSTCSASTCSPCSTRSRRGGTWSACWSSSSC